MKAWLVGLSVGKKIALAVGSFFAMTVVAAAVTPSNTTPTQTNEAPAPVVETKEETKTEAVSFKTITKEDGNLAKGKTQVSQEGEDGERTTVYKVTYTDGKETDREEVSNEITTKPVNKIILKGTYVAPKPAPAPQASSDCDPNYSGCVPIASDVDCAGGSGNGPAYVAGPVQVIGSDIYGLDGDGDGVGCE